MSSLSISHKVKTSAGNFRMNPPKKSGCDWRKVPSRLGFSKIIPKPKDIENPTIELFRECTETTTEILFRILEDTE